MKGYWLAADHMGQRRVNRFLDQFGSELFGVKTRALFFEARAQEHVKMLKEHGAKHVWVDLKIDETPDSAEEAAALLTRVGVDFVTVHASGGDVMMKKVVDTGIGVYAVLILSSLKDAQARRYYRDDAFENMVEDAAIAGVTGFICSPTKVPTLRGFLNRLNRYSSYDIVSPGTRFIGTDANDQEQVEAPGVTIANGADFLVVGRMVTAAPNPRRAMDKLQAEVDEAVRSLQVS